MSLQIMNYLILCLIKDRLFSKFYQQLAVANNRIITLQEEMERVKEESSYILESNRKVRACHCVNSKSRGGWVAPSRTLLGSSKPLHMLSALFSLRLGAELLEWWRLWEVDAPLLLTLLGFTTMYICLETSRSSLIQCIFLYTLLHFIYIIYIFI